MGESSRGFIPASDDLYRPPYRVPSIQELESSAPLRAIHALRTIWRGSQNTLAFIHPDLARRRWIVERIGSATVISVNDADLARHVLQTNADNYGRGHVYRVVFGPYLGRSSLTLDGEAWRHRRRVISHAFNARAMARVERITARRLEIMLDQWEATGGRERDLSRDISDLVLGILMENLFSTAIEAAPPRIPMLLDRLAFAAGTPPLADLLELPSWAPRPGRRRNMQLLSEFDAWLYDLIDERMAQSGEPEDPDVLDILVNATDQETGSRLDRTAVRDEAATLASAGYETTSLSLIWGLDRLAREPEWQERLAEAALAAEAALGGPLGAAHARKVELLPAAYEEMLRLHPPAVDIDREAIQADRFENLEIPEGAFVRVIIGWIHRNPRYWHEAGRFDPERFLGETRRRRHPFAHIPFGGGPRICVGLGLARLEGLMALARILPRFRLEPVGPPPTPMGKVAMRTAAPVRIRVLPRERR